MGAVRVLLGSSTSPLAYFFFAAFWLISAILLVAVVRQLILSGNKERRVEAACVCAGLVSVFVQGLLGNGDIIFVAALVFAVSAVVLVVIYARRLGRRGLAH